MEVVHELKTNKHIKNKQTNNLTKHKQKQNKLYNKSGKVHSETKAALKVCPTQKLQASLVISPTVDVNVKPVRSKAELPPLASHTHSLRHVLKNDHFQLKGGCLPSEPTQNAVYLYLKVGGKKYF